MRRALAVTVLCAPLGVVGPAVAAQSNTVTGSVSVVGDYRFRGLSQTYTQPAVQVGFEYAHALGWYLGTWGSNVSGNQYLNGGSLELDLYGGYRWKVGKLELDAGLLHYWYPRARYNIDPGDHYNTTEVYVGDRYDRVTAKYSLAVSDPEDPYARYVTAVGVDAEIDFDDDIEDLFAEAEPALYLVDIA